MSVYALQLLTAPSVEPVTLTEAKLHCRVDSDITADDDFLTEKIQAAREHCEKHLGQAFFTQSWRLWLDDFPEEDCPIEVPLPPLQSITSVQYLDTSGDTQTLATTVYGVDSASRPGRIYLKQGQSWPSVRLQAHPVWVDFLAGQTSASNVPAVVKQAMKLLIGHWYEHRESMGLPDELDQAVSRLLLGQWHGGYA